MTAPDPRVGEIRARRVDAAARELMAYDERVMLGIEPDHTRAAEIILDAADAASRTDVTYLLAELADRDEKLARVEEQCAAAEGRGMSDMADVLVALDAHRPDHREYEGGWWELACAGCDFAKGQRLSHLDWAPYRAHRAEVFAVALTAAGFGPVQAARAEALEEAADDLHKMNPPYANWLRARAAGCQGRRVTLELFVKHPDMDAYRVGGAYQPYAIVAVDKRFSDAELVAEYWAAHGEANALMTGNPRIIFSRRHALKRFAQLPHASDTNYE